MVAFRVISLSGTDKRFHVIAEEAFWSESFGVIVPCWVPIEVLQAGQYDGVVGDGVATVYNLFGGGMRNGKRSNGAISVKFLDKSPSVREIWLVFP